VDLREKLVKRLMGEFWRGTNHEPSGEFNDHWTRTADECIRQMEWARQACGDGPGRPQGKPLTLAPEGWRPSASGGDDWKP
jgi:hypothetical protein